MRERVMGMVLVLFELGCAGPLRSMPKPTTWPTSDGFEEVLNSWVGSQGTDLVAHWGPPDKTFALPSGGTTWSYRRLSQYTTPVSAKTVYQEATDSYQTTYSGGEVVTHFCYVDLEISPTSAIVRWRYEGDLCVAVPAPAPYECLRRGGVFRVASVGTLSGATDSAEDDFAGAQLSDGSVWRVTEEDEERRRELRSGGRVGVCLESGLGPYLFAFPERTIVRADRAR